MARWIAVVDAFPAGPGGFLLLAACALAVCGMVTALCASHSRRDDNVNRCSADPPDSDPKSPHRVSIKKKTLTAKKGPGTDDQAVDNEDNGEGGFIWQRSILMGERCQPPDFSGVIIYDGKGNRLPEFPPRSPRINIMFSPSRQAADGMILAGIRPKA